MDIKVLNQNGSGDTNVSLPESVFGQEFNADLVHQLVATYTANGHQNTKGQKNRSAVRGGGKKPWKQKGTGREPSENLQRTLYEGNLYILSFREPTREPGNPVPGTLRDGRGHPRDSNLYQASKNPSVTLKGFLVGE